MNTQYSLHTTDPEIYNLIKKEEERQHYKLEMIASENFASEGVREATGSILTNKYAEGYPHKRYYAGCEEVDKIEEIAIERAKTLFHAEYANVQPHSGSSANMAVYMGFLRPGDTVMGMDLAQGGHLTHGSPVSFSGKWYTIVSYGVDRDTEQIDYDALEKLVDTHKPKMLIAGASSYSRVIDFQRFADIARSHKVLLLVDMAHIAGLVAAGVHPSPIAHADVVTTTTHKTLRGPRGGIILVGKNKTNFFDIMTTKGKLKRYDTILNSSVFPGIQGGPLMHVIAAKAVAFKECMSEEFKTYQRQVVVNAQVLAQKLKEAHIRVISGGTDNHLVMIDVSSCGVTGAEAELWLDMANITANKNAIPFDTQPPSIASGIRLGTPAVTSRGVTESGMEFIADVIAQVLRSKGSDEVIKSIGEEVKRFTNTMI